MAIVTQYIIKNKEHKEKVTLINSNAQSDEIERAEIKFEYSLESRKWETAQPGACACKFQKKKQKIPFCVQLNHKPP